MCCFQSLALGLRISSARSHWPIKGFFTLRGEETREAEVLWVCKRKLAGSPCSQVCGNVFGSKVKRQGLGRIRGCRAWS